jgi:acetyl CoA:N6-hydroxylysine acetyl transferase
MPMVTTRPAECSAAPSSLPDWCDLTTRAGRFTLSPVRPNRDLPQLHGWLNDPAVDEYWQLGGDPDRVAEHLASLRELPYIRGYIGRLAGRAIGYWEIYRAAEDRLGRYYPARPSDLGVHLLIGPADCRGIGLAPVLLAALAESLHRDHGCRVVAEPDERNLPSVRAFTRAGFRRAGTLALPEKNAALMVREPGSVTAPFGAAPRPRSAVDRMMRCAD